MGSWLYWQVLGPTKNKTGIMPFWGADFLKLSFTGALRDEIGLSQQTQQTESWILAPILIGDGFVCFFLLCVGPQAHSETVRPNVNDAKLWQKCAVSNLTENWNDNRQLIWCYVGQGQDDQKNYVGSFVVRADDDGNALIWADMTGVHFFDTLKNKIVTPIDLTTLDLKNGPNVGYVFKTDPTLSYFYVQWGKVKTIDKHDGKKHVVSGVAGRTFLDAHGNVLWKKTETLPSKDETLIADVSVSPAGQLLVGTASGDVDSLDDLDSWDVLDKNGEKIGHLPIVPHQLSWSADGKKIKCEWYKKMRMGLGRSGN